MNPNLSPQDRISISLSTQAQFKSKLLSDLDWAIGTILDSQQKAQVKIPVESTPLHGPVFTDDAILSSPSSSLPNKMNKAGRGHAIQFIQGLDRLAQAIEAHCSIATVQITIWRNEEPVDVSVDILSYYKGYTDRRAGFYTDDPPEVITEDYGVTEEGEEIPLIPSEMENAEEIFLSNQ